MVIKYPTHVPPADVYPLSMPNGLLIDKQGRVWFSEHGGNSIGFYDPDRRIMVEYRIPTGPVSTALWVALAPNGDIWFTEWMMNQIGVVHANMPIPLSLDVSEINLALQGNEESALTMTLSPSQGISGNGTVGHALSAYNQQDISLQAFPQYPQLDREVQIQIQLAPSNRLAPGNYTLGLEVDLGNTIISYMLGVTVTSSQNSSEYGIPRVAIFWAGAVILTAAVVAITVRRLSRKSWRRISEM
jgi:sulfite reductase beta subunit-like hemoprotein